jgi:hypothetical protein
LASLPFSLHPLHFHLLSRNFFLLLLTYSSSLPSPARTNTLLQDQWLPLDHFRVRTGRSAASNVPKGSRRFFETLTR